MSDENNGNPNPGNAGGDDAAETPLTPEEIQAIESMAEVGDDGEVTIDDYNKLVKTNKSLYARMKKAEVKAKGAKPAAPPTQPTNPLQPKAEDETSKRLAAIEARQAKLDTQSRLRAQGYNDAEISFIESAGGEKSLENDFVKKGIEGMRAATRSDDAAAPSSPKSPVFQKYTADQLSKMSSAELEKILPHAE